MAQVIVLKAQMNQAEVVSSILQDAANWLIAKGMPLWQPDDLTIEKVQPDVEAGLFWIAWVRDRRDQADLSTTTLPPDNSTASASTGYNPAGCLRFQLEDPFFWPDVPCGESAFIHRLAVRRAYAGGQVADALIDWARKEAACHGRKYLRLDCHPRHELRQVYEKRGFIHHSDRQIGKMLVARYQVPTD